MFFERPRKGTRALLVGATNSKDYRADVETQERELVQLAESIDIAVAARVYLHGTPTAGLYVGAGKLAEISAAIAAHDIDLILFADELAPAQERNLELHLDCAILDRTGLILHIFSARARTHEGKLQVEAAQIQHAISRLVRGWSHLDRQKGGIGLRGVGETQLELDRRMLNDRLVRIQEKLRKVRTRRALGYKRRSRQGMQTLALVGYANAGKTSLFNTLTHSDLHVAEKPFATLDPTLRHIDISGLGPVVLADTVGFMHDLPHHLIHAFKATLEEVTEADFLLHLVDISRPHWRSRIADVESVLAEMGADERPRLLVFNKLDLVKDANLHLPPGALTISARTGAGLDKLLAAIGARMGGTWIRSRILLAPTQGALRAQLYDLGAVRAERISSRGEYELVLRIAATRWHRMRTEIEHGGGRMLQCSQADAEHRS